MFGKLKTLLALNKAAGQYADIKEQIDTMDGKSILSSKTFWLNILGLAATVGGILPVKWGSVVLTVANIGMRFVTNQPVNLFGADSKEK